MRNRDSARRRTLVALVVAGSAMALPVVAAAPTIAADVITREGSVTIESYPSVKELHLDRFDDEGGRLELTQVTVTGTVEGELDGSVTNLSASRIKTLTGTMAASVKVNGPGVSDLTAAGDRTTTWTLTPGATQQVALKASDTTVETITDPAVLDQFVGTGTLDYTVDSAVSVKIDGPAPYTTTGVAGGKATVRIDYTYDEVCVESPSTSGCVEPPQDCVTPTDKIDPVAHGDYVLANGGTFTITSIEDRGNGPVFDWSSTVPVAWISVKGGPQAIGGQVYDYRPDGSFGDEDLHSPLNPNNGKWYGLSHLTICAGEAPDCESAPDSPGCGGSEPSSSTRTAEDDEAAPAPDVKVDDEPVADDQPVGDAERSAEPSAESESPSPQPQKESTPDEPPATPPSATETPADE